jgi:hypothetical protein
MSAMLLRSFCLIMVAMMSGCDRTQETEASLKTMAGTPPSPSTVTQMPIEEVVPEATKTGFFEELSQVTQEGIRLGTELPKVAKELFLCAEELHRHVAENDYEKARNMAETMDRFFDSRALSWYVQILAKEEREGRPAAAELWRTFAATPDISPLEKEALNKMDYITQGNQEVKSLDVILLICNLVICHKFGAGGGSALLAVQHALRPSKLTEGAFKEVLGVDDLPSLFKNPKTEP